MRLSGTRTWKFLAVVGVLAVLTAAAPVPAGDGPSPAPSPTGSVASDPTPSASPSTEPTPSASPAPVPVLKAGALSMMGAMDAGTTGSIAVTVTVWATGAAATGGCVEAYDAGGVVARSSCTPVAGIFTISGLAAGAYTVRAYNQPGMVPMWFGPAATRTAATAVTVADGTTTPVAIRVVPPYTIVGRVTDGSGSAVAGGTVDLIADTNSPAPCGAATVGVDGWYLLLGSNCQPFNAVKFIHFAATPGHPSSWLGSQAVWNGSNGAYLSGTAATVATTQVLSAAPATLSGTIAVPDYFESDVVCLALREWDAHEAVGSVAYGTQCGHRGDAFQFANLPAMMFEVCAIDAATASTGCATPGVVAIYGSNYVPHYFHTVAGSDAQATLSWGGAITVTATMDSPSGVVPLTQGCMQLWTDQSTLVDQVCDEPSGVYPLHFADDNNDYRIHIVGVPGRSALWLQPSDGIFIDGASAAPGGFSSAFYVGDGDSKTVTGRVPLEGVISGTIALPVGVSASQGCVRAWSVLGITSAPSDLHEACADPATGAYRLEVPYGSYRLEFFTNTLDVGSIWSGGSTDIDHAAVVRVTQATPTATSSIALFRAASILVTVTDSHASPVINGCVHAVNDDGVVVMIRCLDGDSSVTIDSLSPGTYSVYFEGSDTTAPAWWGGSENPSTVTLGAGGSTSVHIAAEPLGTITAHLTGPGGSAVTGGCVTAFDVNDGSSGASVCGASGSSVALAVPAGTYQLFATGWAGAGPLADKWFPAGAPSTSAGVAVAAGGSASAAVSLSAPAEVFHIAPRSRYYGGDPSALATGGCAWVYGADGFLVASGCAADGVASLDLHVAPGQYRIYLNGWVGSNYGTPVLLAPMWSGGLDTFGEAIEIPVVAGTGGQWAPVIPSATVISGSVVANGHPVTGGTVEVVDRTSGQTLGTATLDASGAFLVTGLLTYAVVDVRLESAPGVLDQTLSVIDAYRWDTGLSSGVNVREYSASTAVGHIQGVLPGPLGHGPVCAQVWERGSKDFLGNPGTDGLFQVGEACGARGQTFSIGVSGPGHVVSFTNTDMTWWNVVTPWNGPDVVGVRGNETVVLNQSLLKAYGPPTFTWGQTITVIVEAIGRSDGVVPAALWTATSATGETYQAISLSFVRGLATFSLPTSSSDAALGDLYFSVNVGMQDTSWYHVTAVATAVTTVSLSYGSAAGGMTVTLTGSGFTGATSVTFGGVAGTNVVVRSDKQITVTTPAHPVGAVDVVVVTPSGSSPAKTYTYVEAPPPGAPSGFADGITRLSGESRYETAIGVSQQYSPGVPVVFVAAGTNFPDGLSAAAAAAYGGGPLLLTTPTELPTAVKTELIRLAPDRIVVVGGTGAVSAAVATELAGIAPVTRFGGASRYDTSLEVVNGTFASSTTAVIATGRGFPDALAATGVAGSLGAPVILVDGVQSTVSSDTVAALQRMGVTDVIIAGGTAVVSDGIETQLRDGGYTVTRYGGADRYATAALMNSHFFPQGSTDTMFLAGGTNFPDALSGAALAGLLKAPLYITPLDCAPQPIHDSVVALAPLKTAILGGTAAVSDNAANNQSCT